MKSDPRTLKVARILSYLVALIFIALPFHEFLAVWLGSNIGHLDLIRIWKEILITAMALPVLWLVTRNSELKAWAKKSWLLGLYALYALIHLLLGVWALHNHQVNKVALIYGLIINLRFIGFFLICVAVARQDDWLKKHWRRFMLLPGAIVIGFGIAQEYFLSHSFLEHFGYGPKTIPAYETVDANNNYQRIQSTLRGADPLGAYLSLLLPVAILDRLKNYFIKSLYLAAGLVVLFYTYSRSAWIGLILSIASLIYLGYIHLSRRAALSVVALIVIIMGGLYAFHNNQSVQKTLLHTSSQSTSKLSSNAQRSAALRQGANDIIRQPLGRGPGTAGPASFRNNHPARIAENYYLQLGQEVGVLGLATFLGINWMVVRRLYAQREDDLSKLLLASFIGISFINLVSHAWADDTLSLLWWGLAGVAYGSTLDSRGILKSGKTDGRNKKTA